VRELSRLEVREELLPGGRTRSIHELSSGSILVNVARSLMRRGDEVQIRTPNAVAAVRGSTILVQYNAALAQSIFILLAGSAVVTPQGQPSITLTPNTSVNVTGTAATGVQAEPVVTVTQAEANAIVEGSEVGTGGVTEESAEAGVVEATQLVEAVVAAVAEPVVTTIAESPPGEAIDETPVVEVTSDDPAPSTGEGTVSKEATAARVLPFVFRKDTTTNDTPFLQVTNETVDKTVDLITVNSGVTVTLDGKLLVIDPSTVTTTGAFFSITNASLTLGGSLLTSENSTLTANTLFDISGKSTLTNTVGPVIKITGGSLTADSLVDTDDGNTFLLTGTLLDLTDTTVTFRVIEDDVSTIDNDNITFSLAANEPMMRLNNSTLKITGPITTPTFPDSLAILDGDEVGSTYAGLGLIATNNSIITNNVGGLLDFEGVLSTTSTDFLVQITGSTVSTFTKAMFEIEPPPSGSTSITMAGPLLSASASSTLTSERNFLEIRNNSSLTSTTSGSFIQLDNATVNVGSSSFDTHFLQASTSGTVSLAGPLVSATDSSLNVSSVFFEVVDGSQFTSAGTSPVVQLINSPLKARSGAGKLDDFLFLTGSGSKINIAGTLLSSSNSNLTIDDDLFKITSSSPSGSQLFTTSDDPLVLISGGTHTIKMSMFNVSGLSTSDQPIKGSEASFTVNSKTASNPIGVLFKATNGADITVSGSSAIPISLDTLLFEATLPVIELVGTSGAQTKLTLSDSTAIAFVEARNSKLVLKGPVIALDKGLITVKNGPLFSLSGSTVDVDAANGAVIKLVNGSVMDLKTNNVLELSNLSKINVVNGALISVDGNGSELKAGALLKFLTTSGNTFIVNNTQQAKDATVDGINVFTNASGANPGTVTIATGKGVVGLGSNTFSQTGAVIEATNNGKVTIK
jgi:hypothetical protein